MTAKKKRKISMNVLPGEPVNGTGRVCIHLFVPDPNGPFTEPHALHPLIQNGEVVKGKLDAYPTQGRLACDSKRLVAPVTHGGVTIITPRTDDPRATTCLKCLATVEYRERMQLLEALG